MTEWILLGVGLLLTLGTGVFVAAEFSMVNLDRAELEQRQAKGEAGLGTVISALRRTATHLSSAQLGITLTTLLTGFTMEPAITELLSGSLRSWGVAPELEKPIGTTVAMVLATLLSMVLGELIPKNLALAVPLAVAKVIVPLQVAFTWVFRPFVLLLNSSANALIRAVGIEPKEELSGARTAEELSSLVRRSALVGALDTEHAVLLARTLRFSDHTAADVMTPRGRVQAIGAGEPVQALLDLARATGHSRFPVTGEDIDDVEGVAHLKAAAAIPLERRSQVPVGAIREEALFVPETVTLDALLADLRGGGFQLAIVLDEYGGTAGVATMEDLVEEIVGELADEHDRTHVAVTRGSGRLAFDGLLRPDEVREQLNLELEEDGPYETAGGFMMHRLARIPAVGDEVEVETGTLVVERMDGRRVDRIRFEPNERYVSREQLLAEYEARREAEGRDDDDEDRRSKGGER
ncbi:hypothetical protein USB125703_01542 [Pseudoclavibacter triregionum]|nr:hypothetical protein USB125703_01542 [Pseudoclavibacter triregionum]